MPCDLGPSLREAISERDDAANELDRLRRQKGLHSEGELGRAAGELAMARYHQFRNERDEDELSKAIHIHHQHAIERHNLWVQTSQEKVTRLFAPEERRLIETLEEAEHKVSSLSHKDGERSRWFQNHPEVPHRLEAIDSEVSGNEWGADHERQVVEDVRLETRSPSNPAVVQHEHSS